MLTRLGINARARNDLKGGITVYERALAIYEAPETAEVSSAALCLNNLGRFYADSGEYARARSLLERAIHYDESAGDQRGVALRKTQLEMLRKQSATHPFYWASFVAYGQSGPMWR